jgi:hypothetical protein
MEHEDEIARVGISIKHFLPSLAAGADKQLEWYGIASGRRFKFGVEAPSDCISFKNWKEYKPCEQDYV